VLLSVHNLWDKIYRRALKHFLALSHNINYARTNPYPFFGKVCLVEESLFEISAVEMVLRGVLRGAVRMGYDLP